MPTRISTAVPLPECYQKRSTEVDNEDCFSPLHQQFTNSKMKYEFSIQLLAYSIFKNHFSKSRNKTSQTVKLKIENMKLKIEKT